MAEHIMVVDDEAAIADLVEVYLRNEGYAVHKFYCAADALACAKETELDMAILDVMLPDMDGFTLCQTLRQTHLWPIIMLTAKVEDMDKIMVARVKTQLRRYTRYNAKEAAAAAQPAEEHEVNGLFISKATHKCTLYGQEISLTPLEFSILWYLCERRGRVVPSEELFEAVWGEKYFDSNNTVMSHIARLREKLHEQSKKPKFIKTVWGVGYTIE